MIINGKFHSTTKKKLLIFKLLTKKINLFMKKHGESLSVPLIYLTVKERIKKSLDVPGPSIHKLFDFHMSDAAKY